MTMLANVLYMIHFVSQIHGQYTQIWFDNFNQNNGWTASDGGDASLVKFGYDSSGCVTNLCLRTEASYGVDAYVYKSTNVAAYSSLQLQFDVSADGVESGETCRVYYAYNSQSNKQAIKTIEPPNEYRNFYVDQIVNLPSDTSANTVWVWLEADTVDGSSSDRCYWDNVYLRGIVAPAPTLQPTQTSTSTPILITTATSTQDPTLRPTPLPTALPTLLPTALPTSVPTTSPTKALTPIPTARPSASPTPEAAGEVQDADTDNDDADEDTSGDEDDIRDDTGTGGQITNTDMWSDIADNLMLIFFIFLAFILYLSGCFIWIVYKAYQKKRDAPEMMMMAIQSVKSSNVPQSNDSDHPSSHSQRKADVPVQQNAIIPQVVVKKAPNANVQMETVPDVPPPGSIEADINPEKIV